MEYFNKGYKVKKEMKSILLILGIVFLTLFIVQGLFTLLPLGILAYATYKCVKFIKSKFIKLNKRDNARISPFKIYNKSSKYGYNDEVIDVEYEEIKE
ncbi:MULTISPECIES: hypothetical protein [Clostridium]|uniref:Uncharacterized protein n=2 Tax=Clostridium TaxID=1485 RepID=A0A151AN19_9CLOT|nr:MULTISPECIES: hypothetical protein [Clostridium]KYH29023.1 hypothetical protein CLCOL_14630 [Clostridium colicanis DSM 13634]MBE6043394.1 hypothetical protein [Clostridium thermopalmarium]PRR73672.1 hypothetical protein CPAL_12100 [Clostridium thermopalmarium DSM 5974]PVZ21058.1 hypothetical protein LX19_02377 [Clostridium thermopalmarium DSM 5974]